MTVSKTSNTHRGLPEENRKLKVRQANGLTGFSHMLSWPKAVYIQRRD